MNHKNYDELLAKLIQKCKSEASTNENSTSKSSKLLEIESVIRNIDQQLDSCKFLIFETLKHYESKIIVVSNIKKEQENIEIQETNWNEFEASINSRIVEFLKIRKNFLDLVNEQEISNEKYNENCKNIQKTKVQIIHEKNCISDEISKVDENIITLKSQIHETKNRIDFYQIENPIFRDCLEKEEKKWRQRANEAEEKFQKCLNRSQKPEFL